MSNSCRSNYLFALLLLVSASCGDDNTVDPVDGAVFEVLVCVGSADFPNGETFRVLIRDPNVITEAQSRIGQGEGRIITGTILRGDGGFNQPWNWHLDPETVVFTDFAIEVCDGCPNYVAANLTDYVDIIGGYCPWSTRIVRRID